MLREAEVELAGGQTTVEVCRELGIAEQMYYRWRKEYGGMPVSQARRLKKLAAELAPRGAQGSPEATETGQAMSQ